MQLGFFHVTQKSDTSNFEQINLHPSAYCVHNFFIHRDIIEAERYGVMLALMG